MKLKALPDVDPIPTKKPSTDLKARDFALYVDGRRINATLLECSSLDGIALKVAFETSIGSLDGDESASPAEEIAWAGWKPGDDCRLRQPTDGSRYPVNGHVQILGVRRPKRAGEEAMFEVRAITPVYDYVADTEICGGGDYALIPASWFVR